MSEASKKCAKRKSPLQNVSPPVKKERSDDNTVQMTLYSKQIVGNLELIWCERDAQQDGFTQPLATDLLSNNPRSFTSRHKIFMYGSRRMNQYGGVQLNRDTTYPRRYYVRLLEEHETEDERLSILRNISQVGGKRRDLFPSRKKLSVTHFSISFSSFFLVLISFGPIGFASSSCKPRKTKI